MRKIFVTLAIAAAVVVLRARPAPAHCESQIGTMVAAGLDALASGDFERVRPWVAAEQQPELRAAFTRALPLRAFGAAARERAEVEFLGTLVRLHRAGQPAVTPPVGSLADPRMLVARLADWLHRLE